MGEFSFIPKKGTMSNRSCEDSQAHEVFSFSTKACLCASKNFTLRGASYNTRMDWAVRSSLQ